MVRRSLKNFVKMYLEDMSVKNSTSFSQKLLKNFCLKNVRLLIRWAMSNVSWMTKPWIWKIDNFSNLWNCKKTLFKTLLTKYSWIWSVSPWMNVSKKWPILVRRTLQFSKAANFEIYKFWPFKSSIYKRVLVIFSLKKL